MAKRSGAEASEPLEIQEPAPANEPVDMPDAPVEGIPAGVPEPGPAIKCCAKPPAKPRKSSSGLLWFMAGAASVLIAGTALNKKARINITTETSILVDKVFCKLRKKDQPKQSCGSDCGQNP